MESNFPPTNVTQSHTGSGDNVRDKHVYQAISPSAVQKPITDILTCLRHRNTDGASEKLSTLQDAAQLDTITLSILSVVSLLIDLARNEAPSSGFSIAEDCLLQISDDFYRDIVLSALLRLELLSGVPEGAFARYNAMESPGDYCIEVYYEKIAEKGILEARLMRGLTTLTEITLSGLTRGLLGCGSFEHSVSASNRLKSVYPTFNSKVIDLICQCNLFNSQISQAHYWLITGAQHKQLTELVYTTSTLLNECQGRDFRVVTQAICFFNYQAGSNEDLINTCWTYISAIEQHDPEAAELLRSIKERNSTRISGPLLEVDKAKRDFSYRKSLIKQLTANSKITQEQLLILNSVAGPNDISKWLNGGGSVSATSSLEKQFIEIELCCYKNDGSPASQEEIRSAVEGFVSTKASELVNINPFRLLDLTNKLTQLGFYPEVCALLRPVLPIGDLWLSPLARNYISAVANSHQLSTLNTILESIPQQDWCEFLWDVNARQLEYAEDIEGAIKSTKMALELAPDSTYLWVNIVHLNKKLQVATKEYRSLLKTIPDKLFERPSEHAWPLLFEISIYDSFFRAENVLVNWFISDPDHYAKDITNFIFSTASRKHKTLHSPPSDETELCVGGFHYLVNGKPVTKLLTRDTISKHQALLSSDSPLGSFLQRMQTGESAYHGMDEIELVEVLPPYTAVVRIAGDLREANNDGSDCFYQFSLPKDPQEMVRCIENKLLNNTDDHEERICSDPNIPLFLKGFRFEGQCPVHAALKQYCSKSSVKHSLPNFGQVQPEQVIIDAYTVTYLGLTGLFRGLPLSATRLVLTRETKTFLIEFLEVINSADYMRLGVDKNVGKLQIATSEQLQVVTSGVQDAIKYVLDSAEVVAPKRIDLPTDIVSVKNAVDISVYSSLTLSRSNDLAWLCVDPIFAQLSQQLSVPVVNTLQFMMSLCAKLNVEHKLFGLYRHVTCGLPYPVTHENLLQLSNAKDKDAHYFLSKLLGMYPNAYQDSETAVLHLRKILIVALVDAYMDGQILRELSVDNPSNFRSTESVFNACCRLVMSPQDGKTAEQKLAMFLCSILEPLKEIEDLRNAIIIAASRFVFGHFLSLEAVNGHIDAITSRWQ